MDLGFYHVSRMAKVTQDLKRDPYDSFRNLKLELRTFRNFKYEYTHTLCAYL